MTAGASRAAPTIAQQPALAPPPQPPPAPTARALPPGLVEQGGQNWTPIRGQICKPIDTTSMCMQLIHGHMQTTFTDAPNQGRQAHRIDGARHRALQITQPLSVPSFY